MDGAPVKPSPSQCDTFSGGAGVGGFGGGGGLSAVTQPVAESNSATALRRVKS